MQPTRYVGTTTDSRLVERKHRLYLYRRTDVVIPRRVKNNGSKDRKTKMSYSVVVHFTTITGQ